MSTHVLYHANCADGFCAAWIAWLSFGDKETEYIPVQYGSPIADSIENNDIVYILDFCYDEPEMRKLLAITEKVVVLDHHQTRQNVLKKLAAEFPCDECTGFPFFKFDQRKCGARLTAEMTGVVGLWIVDYVEDRDLWKWKLPNSREFSAAIASHDWTFDQWSTWNSAGQLALDRLHKDGAAILRYQAQIVKSHVEKAGTMVIDGVAVPAVNSTTLISEIGEALAKDNPFAACYFDTNEGKRVWSLRSEVGRGVDVSAIATKFGGGGHQHAAGFTTPIDHRFPTK